MDMGEVVRAPAPAAGTRPPAASALAALALAALAGGCFDTRSVGAHAGACGDCHSAQQAAFEASAHGAPPTALFSALEADAPGAAACASCHRPEAPGAPAEHAGLDCTTCHAAVGNAGVGAGAVALDLRGPVRGPTGAPGGPHDNAQSAFLTDAELCGTCHEVNGPPGFVEHTFSEWEESPAAAQGQSCVSCHFVDHRLVGLQAEGGALIARTLRLEVDEDGVELSNLNMGHAVPTGAAWARTLRLRFDTGATVSLSPRLRRDGHSVDLPLDADAVEPRSLPAGGALRAPWPTGARVVCLEYRPVSAGVAGALGMEAPEVERLICRDRP
ncbi:MAG: hypothetical protein JNM72_05540 [Deltaproteobacteria bacterium]|nr:hypothetical protein [Deltaproteobacteria bacterium]